MNNGTTIIRPDEARTRAQSMKSKAHEIEELLNKVSTAINQIDNEDGEVIYQGSKGAEQLRTELDEFRSLFGRVSGQIEKSAKDIEEIANSKENV